MCAVRMCEGEGGGGGQRRWEGKGTGCWEGVRYSFAAQGGCSCARLQHHRRHSQFRKLALKVPQSADFGRCCCRIGPKPPAFLTPEALQVVVDKFGLKVS